MKVIGYIRVSTSEQATGGVSLDAQRVKVQQFAALHDLELVEIIEDAGESAKSLKRPGLTRALDMLKRKAAEGLIVCKLDRLSRSVGDWNALINQYFGERAGKQLFSVGDSIDTRTAAGRLVLNVLMSVAQWEREAISERTCTALAHKKSKGERTGGVPFGFDLAADGVALVPNSAEQNVIERIRELRKLGQSYQTIANELNRESIPTKLGVGKWVQQTVNSILRRPA